MKNNADFILLDFTPSEEQQIRRLLKDRKVRIVVSSTASGKRLPEAKPGSRVLIALRQGMNRVDLELLLYRFRAAQTGILADADAPELLIWAASKGPVPVALLPMQEEELSRLINELDRRLNEENSRQRLCKGLLSLEHRYQWKASDLQISKIASHLAGLFFLTGYCCGSDRTDTVQLALEEALTNSLEHGCLEMDSVMKRDGLAGSIRYDGLLAERLKDPRYGNRKIQVDFSLLSGLGVLTIQDQGKGFDTAIVEKQIERIRKGESVDTGSGKGIYLIYSVFDSIQYLEGGRKLRLELKNQEALK